MQPVTQSLSNLPLECIGGVISHIKTEKHYSLPEVRTLLRWAHASTEWRDLLSYWTDAIKPAAYVIGEFDEAIASKSPLPQCLLVVKRFAPYLSGENLWSLTQTRVSEVEGAETEARETIGMDPLDSIAR